MREHIHISLWSAKCRQEDLHRVIHVSLHVQLPHPLPVGHCILPELLEAPAWPAEMETIRLVNISRKVSDLDLILTPWLIMIIVICLQRGPCPTTWRLRGRGPTPTPILPASPPEPEVDSLPRVILLSPFTLQPPRIQHIINPTLRHFTVFSVVSIQNLVLPECFTQKLKAKKHLSSPS